MVAIAGGKGGCGKTTVTLGLALGLVRRGRRPLAVDADVDVPDLHIRAGVDPEPGLAALARRGPPERVSQRSPEVPGVDVVAAGATCRCPPAALDRLAALPRQVLVDCPAGAGPDAAAPLRAADACVLVTTSEPASRRDVAKTAAMAESLGVPIATTILRRVGDGDGGRDGDGGDGDRGDDSGDGDRGDGGGDGDGAHVETIPTVDGPPLADDSLLAQFERLGRTIDRVPTPRQRTATRPQ